MFHVKPIIELESESKKGKIKIMGYPAFGKVKTITLPFTGYEDGITLNQYKEKYGIDLLDIVGLSDNSIDFKEHNNFILLNHDYNGIYPAMISKKAYVSGVSSATLSLLYTTEDNDSVVIGNGFYLTINQDVEFKPENIRIYGYNV